MENIFKGAYFGKVYRTRDGRKAIYNYHSIGGYHDIIIEGEGSSYHFGDHTNGIIRLPLEVNPDVNYDSPIDIVSEWPFDEDKLTEYAETASNGFWSDDLDTFYGSPLEREIYDACKKCYSAGIKRGYCKAYDESRHN